jgi:hypothetical protein
VLPSGQVRPLSLFLMTIAASGERKSAVDNLALRAIYKYEEKLRAAYRADMEQFKLEQAIWEAQQAAAKAEMRGGKKKHSNDRYDAEADLRALGSGPQAPLMPLFVCPEPTFEGYCKLTAIGQLAMGLFSAEGGSFIGGYGMSMDHPADDGRRLFQHLGWRSNQTCTCRRRFDRARRPPSVAASHGATRCRRSTARR